MNSALDTIIDIGICLLTFDALMALTGYFLIYWIKPLCPEWWKRNIVAPYPLDFETDSQAGVTAYLSTVER